jgi:hypothetical protein
MALCGSLVIPEAPDEIAVMAKQLSITKQLSHHGELDF